MKQNRFFSLLFLWVVLPIAACTVDGQEIAFKDQDVRITFVHLTDTHSKVLPFKYAPTFTDKNLGIWDKKICLDNGRSEEWCDNLTYGGAARAGWIIERERAKSGRFALVDTGDYFQGAPVFNLFRGEAEVRVLSALGVDASVFGNHEFDQGANRLAELLYTYANYSVLNANFMFETESESGSNKLGGLVNPFVIKDYDGLKVGYIGLGNTRSLNSLGDADNSMGVRALNAVQVLQTYVPMIRPYVDLVVVLSHLGVDGDVEAAEEVAGIDIFFGGHDHVVINPPMEVINPEGKKTLVVHSGVNYKFVCRLDVVVRNQEIIAHEYSVFPISSQGDGTGNPLGEHQLVSEILEDYQWELNRAQNLDRVIGIAGNEFPRRSMNPRSADSPLGNLVADAMRARRRVETDFAITNTLGIRADLEPGDITLGKMYEIFPFENSIVVMLMSGIELQKLFDFAAEKTAAYGCTSQIQLSGAKVVLDCIGNEAGEKKAKYLEVNGITIIENYTLIEPHAVFTMATNDYISQGGSGFDMLEQNPTKQFTMLSLRDAVIDYIENKYNSGETEEEQSILPIQDGRIQLLNESDNSGGNQSSDDGPI